MSACVQPIPALVAPPGMYALEGRLYVRRFAPVRPGAIECRLGHPLQLHGNIIEATPQCEAHEPPRRTRCPAHVYVHRLSRLHYVQLDITAPEAQMIHDRRMDLDDVIAYFGLRLPGVRE